MSAEFELFFVITGGPGSGKTTLVAALKAAGLQGPEEVGRQVIKDQAAIGGRALPGIDPALFAELMLPHEIQNYHVALEVPGAVYFDRGMPDVLGYLRLVGLPVPAHVRNAAHVFRYNRRVFIAPSWPEIYETDGSASRPCRRRSAPTARWSRPTRNADTISARSRGRQSHRACSSFSKARNAWRD
jgi:predicted ATPase